MRILSTELIIVLSIIFLSNIAYSASIPIAGRIQDFYGQTKGFSADFTQLLEHKESGSKETRQGSLSFEKPLSIRWHTKKPHEETLVVTDKEIWDYLPDEEIVYRYSPEVAQDSRSIIQVITGQAPLSSDFDVKSMGKENNLEKVTIYPHEPSTQMVEAILWVQPESGQITRARVIDFYGNANDITLKNYKNNPKFSSSEFKFAPPKGIEVEDRVDKQLEERELFK